MDKEFKDSLRQMSLEAMVIQIQKLETDEHVLLARKAEAARELLLQHLCDLRKEQLHGRTLERQGLSHDYLDRLLGGEV